MAGATAPGAGAVTCNTILNCARCQERAPSFLTLLQSLQKVGSYRMRAGARYI